jgi:hypothetical protein
MPRPQPSRVKLANNVWRNEWICVFVEGKRKGEQIAFASPKTCILTKGEMRLENGQPFRPERPEQSKRAGEMKKRKRQGEIRSLCAVHNNNPTAHSTAQKKT